MNKINFIKINNGALLIVSILMIVSGYGISEYQVVEKITFGMLTKSESFQIHSSLGIAFVVLLAIHAMFYVRRK
ncbi:DUF4405 domain-containing protein [Patescibacteria group bacterium]